MMCSALWWFVALAGSIIAVTVFTFGLMAFVAIKSNAKAGSNPPPPNE